MWTVRVVSGDSGSWGTMRPRLSGRSPCAPRLRLASLTRRPASRAATLRRAARMLLVCCDHKGSVADDGNQCIVVACIIAMEHTQIQLSPSHTCIVGCI